jgi:hypothetical protein
MGNKSQVGHVVARVSSSTSHLQSCHRNVDCLALWRRRHTMKMSRRYCSVFQSCSLSLICAAFCFGLLGMSRGESLTYPYIPNQYTKKQVSTRALYRRLSRKNPLSVNSTFVPAISTHLNKPIVSRISRLWFILEVFPEPLSPFSSVNELDCCGRCDSFACFGWLVSLLL